MEFEEKILEMLSSEYPRVRLMAIEQITTADLDSEAIFMALEKATQDDDQEVAGRARKALGAKFNPQAAIPSEPTKPELAGTKPAQTGQIVEHGKAEEPTPDTQSESVNIDDVILRLQLVTFIASIPMVILFFFARQNIAVYDAGVCAVILPFLAFIGLQIYAIRRYGFRDSFNFLKLFLPR